MKNFRKRTERKIVVYRGDENRVKVRDWIDPDDFFYKSNIQAILSVKKNIELFNNFKKRINLAVGRTERDTLECRDGIGCERTNVELESEEILGYSNYAIVFTAGRGSGKTSTMLSFGRMLGNNKMIKQFFNNDLDIAEVGFHVLSCIEPTAMESGDSILKVIISRMFFSFKEQWQFCQTSNYSPILNEKKANLIQCFQKCYRNIDILKRNIKQEDIYDDLYYLSEIGDSTNLKVELYKLINEYLDFMNCSGAKTAKNKNFLILQIDDVDLNEEMAYKILEDLRKYFMLPNVMLLIAADLKQLRHSLERNFADEYKTLLTHQGSVDIYECKKMAERYLEKMFPMVSQIHLPQLNVEVCTEENSIVLEYGEKIKGLDKIQNLLLFQDTEGNDIHEFQQVLLRLIYEKTGIIFVEKPYLHEILPKTMRELTHFLDYMETLENTKSELTWKEFLLFYERGQQEKKDGNEMDDVVGDMEIRFSNLQKFEDYFSGYWCPYNLTKEQQEIYRDIKNTPLRDKTKKIIVLLKEYCIKKEKNIMTNMGTNDFSEVEYMLNKWIEMEEYKEDRYFFVFLLTYFTIYQNRMTVYNFLQGEYLTSIRELYKNYFKIYLPERNIFQQVFPVNYTEFKKIADDNIVDGYQGQFISAHEALFFQKQGTKRLFDVLGPFTACVKDFGKVSSDIWEEDEDRAEKQILFYQSLIQIILNSELKYAIQKEMEQKIKYSKANTSKLAAPTEMMRKVYECIDHAVNELSYLKLKSNVSAIITNDQSEHNYFITISFICNNDIAQYYFEKLKRELRKKIPAKININIEKGGEVVNAPAVAEVSNKLFVDYWASPEDWGIDDLIIEDKSIGELFEVWNDTANEMLDVLEQIVDYSNVEKDDELKEEEKTVEDTQTKIGQIKALRDEYNRLATGWKEKIDKVEYRDK